MSFILLQLMRLEVREMSLVEVKKESLEVKYLSGMGKTEGCCGRSFNGYRCTFHITSK
jgi:hypothetical protein